MTTNITVQNLKCGGCATTIREKLSKIEGIETVSVVQEESRLTVMHTDAIAEETIKGKLAALGYPAVDDKNSLLTRAKSYISCASGKMSKV